MADLHYTNSIPYLAKWGERVGVTVNNATDFVAPYARAHRWLLELRSKLVHNHAWFEITPPEPGMLFELRCPSPSRSSGGLSRHPTMRLVIPEHAGAFFAPDRHLDWQMIFHGALFPTMRHTCEPLADILHLLQCIFTGMLVLVLEEDVPGQGPMATCRGLPPADWMAAHRDRLSHVLGQATFARLFQGASKPRVAFSLGRPPQATPLPQA